MANDRCAQAVVRPPLIRLYPGRDYRPRLGSDRHSLALRPGPLCEGARRPMETAA